MDSFHSCLMHLAGGGGEGRAFKLSLQGGHAVAAAVRRGAPAPLLLLLALRRRRRWGGVCVQAWISVSVSSSSRLVSPGIVTTGGGMTKVSILKFVMFGMYDVPFDPGPSLPCSPGMKFPSRAWNETVST